MTTMMTAAAVTMTTTMGEEAEEEAEVEVTTTMTTTAAVPTMTMTTGLAGGRPIRRGHQAGPPFHAPACLHPFRVSHYRGVKTTEHVRRRFQVPD
jgi:hypothetical protein